jgi:hypothetical protein
MTSNSPTRNRDAGSGEFVTEEYAEAHPDTTVHEKVEERPHVWALLSKLSTTGGAIVREQDLSPEDLEQAKSEGRHWGGFVYEPIDE